MTKQFANDVAHGLRGEPKTLPSKYFYDKKGDALFMQIMDLPEYYLTRAEMEIFTHQTEGLIDAIDQKKNRHFELVELGAGDGQKTVHLLRGLLAAGYDFTYVPVDISPNVLEHLEKRLLEQLPDLKVESQAGDYFQSLEALHKTDVPRVILYLGSNLGNLTDDKSKVFMTRLSASLQQGDRLVLGVDKIKPQSIVLPAYNDSAGVTSAFNLNLLTRINAELGGSFDLSAFRHAPDYSETEGIATSYLESLKDQTVKIDALDEEFEFSKGEKLKVEISRKYDLDVIGRIIEKVPFEIETVMSDSKGYFLDVVMRRTSD